MAAPFEVIDAFVDGERVDPVELERALADKAGRDYMIDAWLLRESVHDEVTVDVRVPASASRWRRYAGLSVAAAIAAVCLAGGYGLGSRRAGPTVQTPVINGSGDASTSSAVADPSQLPDPTRVIQMQLTPGRPPASMPIGAREGGMRPVAADLWLVHTAPGSAPQVVHQTVQVPITGAPFALEPVTFTTTGGPVTVEFTGAFRPLTAAGGAQLIAVDLSRAVTGVGASAGLDGSASTLIPVASAEVAAFEFLPAGGSAGPTSAGAARRSGTVGAARGLTGGTAARTPVAGMPGGHQLSIRVRLTPEQRPR